MGSYIDCNPQDIGTILGQSLGKMFYVPYRRVTDKTMDIPSQ